MMDNKENIDELFADSAFKEKIETMSDKEIKDFFARNGIAADVESASEAEMDEAALENVIGGSYIHDIWKWIKVKGRIIKVKNASGKFDGGDGGYGF